MSAREDLDKLLERHTAPLPGSSTGPRVQVKMVGLNSGQFSFGTQSSAEPSVAPASMARPEFPQDAQVVRSCPQCRVFTWRGTRLCWKCHCDLFAYDARQRGVDRRRLLTHRLIAVGSAAAASFALAHVLPPSTESMVLRGMGLVAVVLGAIAVLLHGFDQAH